MKNNLFLPVFRSHANTTLTQEDIGSNLFNGKTSSLFSYSLLKSKPPQIIFSYNLMLIQILRLGLTFAELDEGNRSVEVRIRFSNKLLLVYAIQLAIGFICMIAAGLYLNDPVLKAFFVCLPILIYIVIIVNFHFFKFRVMKKLHEVGLDY
ncbi:hypothetical protein ACFSKL_16135 [Belliella marina]|uniref:Uncharacterized protein n=1 Tax=Belliella marina TaxID=1644146 RepID=A0ABW4VNR2_9BACT